MQPHQLPDGGGTYYSILFYVVLLFGLTELKAQISWIDNVCLYPDPSVFLFVLIGHFSTRKSDK
ncbi:hypothetical protein JVT61DRAFT_733 [Boletus reticuloceps]|uniref:Uncharacterized protein n=1 Tax=Boletus reticuloceps TaxID=495285 RepID=A0A8I2Z235_9AGAM|nr:hypothetical protein JVT61DRAFT_733 [Boletus reticuloceps]